MWTVVICSEIQIESITKYSQPLGIVKLTKHAIFTITAWEKSGRINGSQ